MAATNEHGMKGKVCVVTGASAGIGKETAVGLARRGATTVMVCRDRARGEAALAEVRERGGSADVHLFLADLSSQAEIRRVAGELLSAYPKIHVLCNNAGAINMGREVTVDGLERTFATNHLAYFLLTELLLPALKAAAPARVVNVASGAHRGKVMNFEDLQFERSYSGFHVYGHSKLANILYTRELSRRLAGTGVTANCLHPGVVASNFGSNQGLLSHLIRVARVFMINVEEGARTSLYLCCSPEVEGVTGKYFKSSRESQPTRAAQDDAAARRLWEISERLCAAR